MSLGGYATASGLDSSVLVLNKLFMAVHVISARRAFCLLFKELAEVVTFDDGYYQTFDFESWCLESRERQVTRLLDEDWVRTKTDPIAVPRIIRLLGYDRLPGQRVKFNRRNVFARDGNRCQYCGQRFTTALLSLDHVMPRSRGGPATWENIVSACRSCNVRKGGRTPQEANMNLLREPIKPRTSPSLRLKLNHRKYRSWKTFLDHACWSVELK